MAAARIAGLTWTCRPDAPPVLEAVPAHAWADPPRQGWTRVKQNSHREVWRATIQNRPLYLKYYFRRGWLRRLTRLLRGPACRREWAGGVYAEHAGIAAARPLAYTLDLRRAGRYCSLLITEAIEPAQPLNEFWLQLEADDNALRRRHDEAALCEQVAELIARAHQAGFEHLDMHAANLLVQTVGPRQYRAAFVDLQSARRGVPLSPRAVVRNLAQLNQWFRKHSSAGQRLRFLRAYLRWRNEFETRFEHGRALELSFEELVAALDRVAHRHAERLGGQRDRRTRRDGRYFTPLKLPGGWRGMAVTACKHPTDDSRASSLAFDRKWWRAQFANPLRWFADAPAADGAAPPPASAHSGYCKNSHSSLVRRGLLTHEAGNVPVMLKRPLARNWQRRLALLRWPSRSLRGWRLGHALLHRDVPTARPLVVLERRFGPLVLDSVLVTEAIPGAVDLEAFLQREHSIHSPPAWAALKRQLITLAARQLRRLHAAGFAHRDCKATNLLVVRYPRLALLWIDLDGIRPVGRPAINAGQLAAHQLRALARLHVSLLEQPGLTRTDRVRFLRTYLQRYGAPPDEWRTLWPALTRLAAKKHAAKQARRAWKLKHYGRA
ncbi:MAG: lipopolysaccharide kinase InaA family protein [Planctomycetota bacterium]